jgi:hypothetical protein
VFWDVVPFSLVEIVTNISEVFTATGIKAMTVWRNIPGDSQLHTYCCENLKISHTELCLI